jgi:methylglutaconyl-CoA hydratase
MSESVVLVEVRPQATIVTINRPERRNALNRQLVTELTSAVRAACADAACRCIILTGAGGAFCAGMDLAELVETLDQPGEAVRVHEDAQRLNRLYELIYTAPKPTIAAVSGAAVAGGAGLMTVCDLAVAAQSAKLGYPEVKRGLVAAMVMPHLLRHVGQRAARDLLLRGALIDAAEALRIGLVNAVVPADQVLPTALAWAKEFGESGPQALALTKELLHELDQRAGQMAGRTQHLSAEARLHVEAKAGLRAFLEKRNPPWFPAVATGP